jgi:endonuclease YncB( thermonuclease family)
VIDRYQREQSIVDICIYEAAEYDAKIAKRGLWSDFNPIPPWEFRHGSKTNELVGESEPNKKVNVTE